MARDIVAVGAKLWMGLTKSGVDEGGRAIQEQPERSRTGRPSREDQNRELKPPLNSNHNGGEGGKKEKNLAHGRDE
jgi:hypothetical protein